MYTDSWSLRSAVSLWTLIVVGILGAVAFGWIALKFAPTYLVPASFVGFLSAVGVQALWSMRRLKKNLATGADLQRQLHDLKKQEFDLRYAEAKARGDLDEWKKDT